MKKSIRRILSGLLCAGVLALGIPAPSRALTLTAVNDSILPLSDSTMPARLGGEIYVPYSVFSQLGVSASSSDGLEFSWLLFNGLNTRAFYRRILQAHGGRQVFMPSGVSEIAQLLDSIFTGCAADERPGEAQLSQMLHRMLGLLLLDDTSPAHAGSDRIAEAIRYMNRHLFDELSVQEVAASVSLSSSHFSRQFKAKTGYSPYEYIILRRIDKAKYLLTSTPLSVKEIAYATGYNSEENFIHSFRSNVGIAPGLFRKYPI